MNTKRFYNKPLITKYPPLQTVARGNAGNSRGGSANSVDCFVSIDCGDQAPLPVPCAPPLPMEAPPMPLID